jgi:CubicO group peptidase (beta-lactamase class C family)
MKPIRILMASLIAAAASATDAADTRAQAILGGDWRAAAAAAARAVVEAGLTPGAAVAVAVGDWVSWADGFGTADLATGRGASGDTPFYIASTTKSLTALAAVLAAHRGDLDLNAPMVRYLPGARLAAGVDRESISVRDLLMLTHGLAGDGPVVLRTAYTGEFTREQLLDLLRYHAPTGAHGTFDYNNLGYNLLGLVLEAVYNEPWQDIVHRLVVEPVGMRNTSARLSTLGRDALALPHGATSDGWRPAALDKADANLHAAGGHFASARDLARYLAAHISGGMVEGTRVWPEDPVRETQRSHVQQNRRFGPFHRFGWGYGWDLGTYAGDTLVHRFGGFGGYRSHVSFMPRHEVGVVVLVNGNGPASAAADLLATHIYDLLLARPGAREGFAARLDSLASQLVEYRRNLAGHLAERHARLAPLPHPLEHYAGSYESPVLGRMDWRVVAGGLELRMGVVHSRAEVFNALQNALRIEVGGSGQVANFLFPDAGGPARAVRLAGQEFVRTGRQR